MDSGLPTVADWSADAHVRDARVGVVVVAVLRVLPLVGAGIMEHEVDLLALGCRWWRGSSLGVELLLYTVKHRGSNFLTSRGLETILW